MPTTTNLEIEHIVANQDANYVTANTAFDSLDGALAGVLSVDCAGASDVTLTDAQALLNMIFLCTGTLTGSINLIVPTNTKIYAVTNGTSGAYTLTVKTSGGTGILVPQGEAMLLYCDGTNVEELVTVAASEDRSGLVELATDAEAITGSDTARAVTPANVTAVLAEPPAIGGTTPAAVTGTTLTSTTTAQLASYTVAGVPSASPAGQVIYVSDETGGGVLAFSDGSDWRRSTDRAIVS